MKNHFVNVVYLPDCLMNSIPFRPKYMLSIGMSSSWRWHFYWQKESRHDSQKIIQFIDMKIVIIKVLDYVHLESFWKIIKIDYFRKWAFSNYSKV